MVYNVGIAYFIMFGRMLMKRIRLLMMSLALISIILLQGCSNSDHGLDADDPVTLTLWHYYTGSQKQSLDKLVEEFNVTQGKEKGILIKTVAKGSMNNISTDLEASLNKKVNASPLPDIFAAYPDTVEKLDKEDQLVKLNTYLSDDEISEYVDAYMEDGKLYDQKDIKIFPVAKATEVLVINKNAWEEFAQATGAKNEDLATWEGLCKVAESYYTYSGGKAFFGRDAIMNYLYTGSAQLGSELFSVKGTVGTLHADKETLRKLWDHYYIPYVKGYFTKNGKFASDDMKTLDIIASVSSTASATFYPKEIVKEDGSLSDVDYLVLPSPDFEDTKPYAVMQGAGMAVTKSDETHEYASVLFLKWFTEKERNTIFSAQSSYLPVKKESTTVDSWNNIVSKEGIEVTPLLKDIVSVSMDQVQHSTLYSGKTFTNSYEVRQYLENSIRDKASEDQEKVLEAVKEGKTRAEALKSYLSDQNFNAWYENMNKEITALLKE